MEKESLNKCPRCNDYSFESLETYAHCVSCNYFEDYEGNEKTIIFLSQNIIKPKNKATENYYKNKVIENFI